jgi:hypothetical protein
LRHAVDRTAARVGFGFEGIARRLLLKVRARHSRCKPWPDFPKTSVVELAVELGQGCCDRCEDRYTSFLDIKGDTEIESLLLRLIPSIEWVLLPNTHSSPLADMSMPVYRSDLPQNRAAGAQLLGILALSHSVFRAALERANTLQRTQLSLHECRGLAIGNDNWRESIDLMSFLRETLSNLPSVWFDVEKWSLMIRFNIDPHPIWENMAPYAAALRAKLEYAPFFQFLMYPLIAV